MLSQKLKTLFERNICENITPKNKQINRSYQIFHLSNVTRSESADKRKHFRTKINKFNSKCAKIVQLGIKTKGKIHFFFQNIKITQLIKLKKRDKINV